MYEDMGNYNQYAFYLKKYTQIKDSLFTIDTKNQINQLETDYIVGKKNNELLRKDAAIQQQKNQRNILLLIALGTISLLAVALYFNKRLQLKKKEVEKQNTIITQQKEELENLNQVKDRLFSVISHDLRNPLTSLQSYLMLSDNESLSADKRILFKNQSIQAVAQTGNLLDNLLTWAKMQLQNSTPILKPLLINEAIQDVLDLLKPQASQKQLHFIVQLEPSQIIADYEILTIALRNILTNAVKYSPMLGDIHIRGNIKEANYHISIGDQGPGISAALIESILQSNQISSAKGSMGESGSGLGLYLVKQLLQRIDVPLVIESEEGKGALFTLILKLAN